MRTSRPTWSLAILTVLPLLAGCLSAGEAPRSLEAAEFTGPAYASPSGEVREFHLYVSEAAPIEPYPGKVITGFGFSFSPEGPFTVPGPEIRVQEGDLVRAWLHDNAGLSGHTIHWHGLSLPWAMDGVPYMTQTISAPGQPGVYLYEWVAKETGTYWYHCHVDAPSHIDAGLFGPLIIEPRDPARDMPFDREATLMIHEFDSTAFAPILAAFGGEDAKNYPRNPFDLGEAAVGSARTTADVAGLVAGTFTEAPVEETGVWAGPRDYYPEWSLRYRPKYDTFMINGKSFPETEPLLTSLGETVRIRLVNAGQLVHTMHLHGHHFLVTHKDGYNLPAPYYADTILIGPAERYDLYVKSDNPGVWDLHDHGGAWNVGGYASNEYAFPGGISTMLVYEDFEYAQLPEPGPEEGAHTSGDYMVFARSYKGLNPAPVQGPMPQGHAMYDNTRVPPVPRAPAPGATTAPAGHGAHGGLPHGTDLLGTPLG